MNVGPWCLLFCKRDKLAYLTLVYTCSMNATQGMLSFCGRNFFKCACILDILNFNITSGLKNKII